MFREGANVWFTSSKTGGIVYAVSVGWPGREFTTRSVRAAQGSEVFMLGFERPLNWHQDEGALVVEIPQSVADNKPCQYAYAFKIQTQSM